jgi:sulfonate transport system substrate-binding protein
MSYFPRLRWKLPALLAVSLLAAACGLSDDHASTAIDSVKIAAKTDVPPGAKLVVAEQNATQSLPWNLANAGKDAPYSVEFADFSGGSAVIEALRSGAADVGSIGEAPVPIAVDSGVTDLVTIGLQANRVPAVDTFWWPSPAVVSPRSKTFVANASPTPRVPGVT